MNTAAKLNSQLLLASASGAVLESVTEVADKDGPYRSYFQERHRRMLLLAERLRISPNMSETEIWAFIGQVLAQQQIEFRDFPVFKGYVPSKRGAPIKEELAVVNLALAVAASIRDKVTKTAKETLEAMKRRGEVEATIPSLQKSVSNGRKILKEREAAEDAAAAEWAARVAEGRRRKPKTSG